MLLDDGLEMCSLPGGDNILVVLCPLLHFIKTSALTKTYENDIYVNADLA